MGVLEISACSIIFGTYGVIVRGISETITPIAQVVIRSLFSFLIFLIFFISRKKTNFSFSWKKDFHIPLLGGMMGVGLMSVFFTLGVMNTTISNTFILLYTEPFFASILGLLILNEKLDKRIILGLLLSFAGVFLIFFNDFSLSVNIGNIFALLSGFLYAFFPLSTRVSSSKEYESSMLTLVFFGASAVSLIPFLYAFEFSSFSFSAISNRSFFFLILLACLNVVANFLLADGFKRVRVAKGSLFLTLEPLSALFISAVFLGESFSFLTIFGAVLILSNFFLNIKESDHPSTSIA